MKQNRILSTIVIAQFGCTSIWFASNAVIDQLITAYSFPDNAMSVLTSAVQLGFIAGTLSYALLNLTDKYSPSTVFLISALIGASANYAITWVTPSLLYFSSLRFLVGFFLAGIYPVGMKIAADYYQKGLGKSLGYLIGALVIGTALPHLLRGSFNDLSWQVVFVSTSALCATGGILIRIFVPDGPHRRPAQKIKLNQTFLIFRDKKFTSAALGYFGHMWELYTFWALVPAIISFSVSSETSISPSILSFGVIGIGSVACIVAGRLSQHIEPSRIAYANLLGSGLCALGAGLLVIIGYPPLIYGFLLVWGWLVIADSPMFSTLVANSAPAHLKGSALTLVNCIGYAITIISLLCIGYLYKSFGLYFALPALAIGPVLSWILHQQGNHNKTPVIKHEKITTNR
ncbi:MFS transporter [Reichenbachiella agariperforans]|uniref:MFS transporter n=1 Tax=Reichenbachiella agariperforans TaxID=156994 RepID=UPI002090E6BD|nr:MFS transporter [Reichenbachiella agariperforans]